MKNKKKNALVANQIERTVVNISSHPLTGPEELLLAKGLTFCPSTPHLNHTQLTADLHEFYRRLRLHYFFAENPSQNDYGTSLLQGTSLRRKSLWQPPKGTIAPELETFIKVFHQSIRHTIKHTKAIVPSNITRDERLALQSLRNLQERKEIMIRPADKGSAIVIQNATDYEREAMRQLADEKFYKKLNNDPTQENNAIVRKAVHTLHEEALSTTKQPGI